MARETTAAGADAASSAMEEALRRVQRLFAAEVSQAKSDLHRVLELTKSAGDTLAASVQAAEVFAARHARLTHPMAASTGSDESTSELHGAMSQFAVELARDTANLEAGLSNAVRVLQFEDITSQVIGAVMKRWDLLIEALDTATHQNYTGSAAEALCEVVDCVEKHLEASDVRMPAEQASLQEGESVLF